MPPPIPFPKPEPHIRSRLTGQAGATEPRDQFVSRCPLQPWYPPDDLGSCEFAPAVSGPAAQTQALDPDPDPSAHG